LAAASSAASSSTGNVSNLLLNFASNFSVSASLEEPEKLEIDEF
jgi:hypothetical protein